MPEGTLGKKRQIFANDNDQWSNSALSVIKGGLNVGEGGYSMHMTPMNGNHPDISKDFLKNSNISGNHLKGGPILDYEQGPFQQMQQSRNKYSRTVIGEDGK